MKPAMDEDQRKARNWLVELKARTGLSYGVIASEAGISHTTLTRFMSGRDVKHTLSARTLEAGVNEIERMAEDAL